MSPGEGAHHHLRGPGKSGAGPEAQADADLLEPEMSRRRGQALRDVLDRLGRQIERGGDGDGDPVPVQAPARIAGTAQRSGRPKEDALEGCDVTRAAIDPG